MVVTPPDSGESAPMKPLLLFYQGELRTVSEWSEIRGFDKALIHNRLKRGWPVSRAIGETRSGRGEKHHLAKLTESDVMNIIRLKKEGATIETLADRYAVSVGAIRKVVYGKSWAHVPREA